MENLPDQSMLTRLKATSETQLEIALEKILSLTHSKLRKQREDGGWSIAQCLEHLNTYSDHYLPLIERSLITADFSRQPIQFKNGVLGKMFIKMMDPDINKLRYKAAKQHVPQSLSDPHQIVASFLSNQRKLITLIKESDGADLNRIRIKTSINKLIRLKLGDTLQFLIAHNERHLRQALKMLS